MLIGLVTFSGVTAYVHEDSVLTKWRGLSPEVAKQYHRIKDEEDELLLDALKRTCRQQVDLVMTPEAGVQFIADFTELAGAARGRNVIDLEKFRDADGDEESTIRICNHALLGSKTQPRLLRYADINFERGRLREIAGKGESSRAMVLEGKIARVLGQEDYVIQLWEQAMGAAVAQSEAGAAALRSINDNLVAMMGSRERDAVELSSPWVELTLVRDDRRGFRSAHSSASIDDFYAESGWKYIEDEPPDHLKPTPFDSYPAAEESNASDTGFLPTLRRYAPAFLYRAKMLLQETLWAEAQTPASALKMTEQRYSYASKADYEAGIRKADAKPTTDCADDDDDDDDDGGSAKPAVDPANLYYNPTIARTWLTHAFYATQAHDLRRRLIAEATRSNNSGKRATFAAPPDVEDVGSRDDDRQDKYPPGTPQHVTVWLEDTDVREMYEHEVGEMVAKVRTADYGSKVVAMI
ncbi:hypothetical protein B0A54_17873 [Friedmanniomyces endolithicus]|uniref:Uncharacterized protein n=1 Tax=Friedmanniomyces endolithicus TaxID=329885 RepID=A0A4U0TNC4_9PEZI|nr:hypothetical protein B0A54_17873 [Friedmanniomyces endolithicus]